MRDVREHPQTVHLAHYVLAEVRQPVVPRRIAARVGPLVRVVVRQGHVAHAEAVELAQRRQRVLNRVPALYAHQHADLPLPFRAPNVRGRGRKHQVFRVLLNLPVRHVNQIERARRRPALRDVILRNPLRRRVLPVNINRKELARHPRLLQALQVRVILPRRRRAQIVILIHHNRRDVVMPVHDDRLPMNRQRTLPQTLIPLRRR